MPNQRGPIKTREELQAFSASMSAHWESGLSKDWGSLERYYPLALMLKGKDEGAFVSHKFTNLCDSFMGIYAESMVLPCVEFHKDLTSGGHTSEKSRFEFGCDSSAWVVADREFPESRDEVDELVDDVFGKAELELKLARRSKAFVLETQNRNILLVLNERFGKWTIHIREFWPLLVDSMGKDVYQDELLSLQSRKDLTILDVLRLSSQAEKYSDCIPGVDFPKRPNLGTFLDGSLLAGDSRAGIGLRYGDSRDRGCILSLDWSSSFPEVNHSLHVDFGAIDYIGAHLFQGFEEMNAQNDESSEATVHEVG